MPAGGSGLTSETSPARRLYLFVGDLLANVGLGALVGLIVSSSVGEGWPVVVGMAASMAVGTLVSVPASMLLAPFFGAFEVMLPGMASAMLAGMVVGMRATAGSASHADLAGLGAASGLAVLVAVRLLDRCIRRKGATWTS